VLVVAKLVAGRRGRNMSNNLLRNNYMSVSPKEAYCCSGVHLLIRASALPPSPTFRTEHKCLSFVLYSSFSTSNARVSNLNFLSLFGLGSGASIGLSNTLELVFYFSFLHSILCLPRRESDGLLKPTRANLLNGEAHEPRKVSVVMSLS